MKLRIFVLDWNNGLLDQLHIELVLRLGHHIFRHLG
jgi:hypothetical protein